MKYSYSIISFTVLLGTLLLFSYSILNAQCPVGYPAGATAYDTTIVTPTGINTLHSVSVENNSASPQTADVYYRRTNRIIRPRSYYHYEAQVSRNGITFETLPKNTNGSVVYSSIYNMTDRGRYFSRIRQVNDNYLSYFTNTKYINAGSTKPVKFIVYPNPSMA